MMKVKDIKKKILSTVVVFTMACTVLLGSTSIVSADASYNGAVGSTYTSDYGESKYTVDKKWVRQGGTNATLTKQDVNGTMGAAELVDRDTGFINENNFRKLTDNSQRQVIKDLNASAEKVLETEDNKGTLQFTDEDYQNWVEQLQQQDGVGSRLISTLMANTKPDFASANRIYQPFSGTVGTILGLVAVLLMAALAIVMVLDLAYIAIPFVRNLLDGGSSDNGNGGGGIKSKFVSWEAYNAVQQVEAGGGNGGNSGGDNKTAVGIYFKKRIIMLLILGLCLLYLVQGEIFTMVGWFMDLVSGLLPTS